LCLFSKVFFNYTQKAQLKPFFKIQFRILTFSNLNLSVPCSIH
jgi:hypothetical protein